MRSQQPPLDQRRDPVHAGKELVDVFSTGASGALAAPFVGVAELADAQIPVPAVGDHMRPGLDIVEKEPLQRGCRRISQRLHPHPPETVAALLDSNADEDLLPLGAATRKPRLLPADVGLVHLHQARQSVSARTDQNLPQSMQHRPRRHVRADLQRPLQALGRHPVLARREQPARFEPHRQRGTTPIEQRSCRHRDPFPTRRALVAPVADAPSTRVPAGRAHEAIGPPQPFQIIQTVGIGAEPRTELTRRPRIVHGRSGPERLHHPRLVRSNEYPSDALCSSTATQYQDPSPCNQEDKRSNPSDTGPSTTSGSEVLVVVGTVDLVSFTRSIAHVAVAAVGRDDGDRVPADEGFVCTVPRCDSVIPGSCLCRDRDRHSPIRVNDLGTEIHGRAEQPQAYPVSFMSTVDSDSDRVSGLCLVRSRDRALKGCIEVVF